MANFNTHFVVAASVSAVVSGTLLSMEVVAPEQAVIAFILGTLGGLLPDIDSDHSTSIDVGFNVISLLMTILAVFIKSSTYSIVEMLVLAGVVFAGIRYGLIGIFRQTSKHRGMFHSIPVALIWGASMAIIMHLFFGLNALVAWIYGFMISMGYLVHLTLDEVYSVDLGNKRMKKSFGSALKFGMFKNQQQKIHTAIIYAALIGLLFVAPDTSMLQTAIFSQEAWLNFQDVLIPHDGNWFLK